MTATVWPISFYGVGTQGEMIAQALSEAVPDNPTFAPGEDMVNLPPTPGGATLSSAVTDFVIRVAIIGTVDPMTGLGAEAVPYVKLTETGTGNFTITGNPIGGMTSAIELVGSHSHIDSVSVANLGLGLQAVNSNFPTLINMQRTTMGSDANYNWQNEEQYTGNFDPSSTVTVSFSLNMTGQQTPNFRTAANLVIQTPQISIIYATNDFATGGFFGGGIDVGGVNIPANGLTIADGNGNILYNDPGASSGGDLAYVGQWTFPAQQFENIQFTSTLYSGPFGQFAEGTTSTQMPFLGYSFKMQLNPGN